VIGVSSNHPGSVGGYRAQGIQYDRMGRAVKQSNPTEIDGAWNPTGDDAAGWLYTKQTYDWKGRPRITTNTDGTQRSASYEGCGCAGGEVVTLTDEAGRQQKVYSDALGRRWKTEVLNWDGSVYSTTTSTFNALNQVTFLRQYQGTDQSGAYQETAVLYDGYGRLQGRHVPEQDAGRNTVYAYNADDTLDFVKDARGVKAVYGYGNGRHLVTSISYNLSEVLPGQNVAPAAGVTFSYDAAGNRTGMTDGLGQATYSYDGLSRLASETRQLPVGTYSLTYSYNLADELTGVTDNSFGTSVAYAYSSSGQLKEITGGGLGLPSPQLAYGIQYRAWGGVKAAAYADGRSLTVGYDARLRPASFQVPGLLNKTYDYYADGRLRYADDLSDGRYDRLNLYDHAGRLTQALTGSEARGDTAEDGPYNQTYGYDAFDNNTSRSSRHWSASYDDTRQYSNGRNSAWAYDAEGNSTNDTKWTYRCDAAERMGDIIDPVWPDQADTTHAYDGDGQMLRAGTRPQPYLPPEATYYLRSTALGGRVVAEVGAGGQKLRGFVYDPAGGMLAVQKLATDGDVSAYVAVEHRDASGASVRMGGASGTGWAKLDAELDPVGAGVGLEDHYANAPLYTPPDEASPNYPSLGNPTNLRGKGCSRNGVPEDCGPLMKDIAERAGGVANYEGRVETVASISYYGSIKVTDTPGGGGTPVGDEDVVRINSGIIPLYRVTAGLGETFSFSGYMGGGATLQQTSQPQKTPVSPEDLKNFRDRIKQTLKNPDCQTFLQKIFDEAKAATGVSPTDILDTFDQVQFYWENTSPYGGEAYNSKDNKPIAKVHNAFKTEKFISADRTGFLISQTTEDFLAETLHHVSPTHSGGLVFNDLVMANAVNAVLIKKGKDSKRQFPTIQAASIYWHPLVWAACPAPRK